jgi:hypothetical protein
MDTQPTVKPWLEIWTKPRKTIRYIVERNPNYRLFWLCLIYGFPSLFALAQSQMLGLHINFIPLLLILALIAPFWGYLFFSFFSWAVYKTGKWLGGQAPYTHLRAAFAWSNVPALINVFIWFVLLSIHGPNLFKGIIIYPEYDHIGIIVMMALFAIQVVLAVWGLVLYFNALAEVQYFSVGRAILM